jgi:hypothetical protein
MVDGAVAHPAATTIRKSEVDGRYGHRRSPAYAGKVTGPLYPRAASVILGVRSHRAGGGNVAPKLVDATPSGNLPGHGTARRCGPASLESAVGQVAALPWYPCFGRDVASLLHDCGLSSTIRVLN